MSLLNVFQISASAMSAQSLRLNTVASNLANADSTSAPGGVPYKAKQVQFMAAQLPNGNGVGVKVDKVTEDNSAPKLVYMPGHPNADEKGYVAMPNINPVEEMVNMMSASRSYQSNVDVMNAAKSMLLKTLTIGQ
jgi:flagellar basal-body rod protein FlgC